MRFKSGIKLKNLDLLEALTLKGADDLFDMERMEVRVVHILPSGFFFNLRTCDIHK